MSFVSRLIAYPEVFYGPDQVTPPPGGPDRPRSTSRAARRWDLFLPPPPNLPSCSSPPPHSPVRASPLLTLISVMTASQLIVQFCVLALVCLFPASTSALPAHSVSTIPSKRSTITTLTSTQVSSYTPYAYYAAAGYCKPNTTITWSCGLNCNATSTFIPVASGGDEDSSTPRYCEYPVLLLLFLGSAERERVAYRVRWIRLRP